MIRLHLRLVSLLALALMGLSATPSGNAAPQAAAPLGAVAQPLWMRYPQISPDGREIAFSFQGGLWVVPAAGGTARVLVAHGAYSRAPVWSPDGRQLAYASDVAGNFDVYLVAAEGGPSRRLTLHSAPEVPVSFTPDGREVLFEAHRMDAPRNLMFPAPVAGELYKVATDGGRRPTTVLTTPALGAQIHPDGQTMLYEDWRGYEDDWRKRQTSAVARDVWLYDRRTGAHRQLTRHAAEDRNPVWGPDGRTVFFLSERNGSFNVWKMPLDRPDEAVQVTRLATHPVRFLSAANDGTLAFGHDGELYTMRPGAASPLRVAVRIASDTQAERVQPLRLSDGVTEIAPSPDGKEVAFVARGEVFVASTEFGNTRRITDTPEQERSVSFSPDGRRLVFAGEREGSWNLYEARLDGTRREVPSFHGAATVSIRTLLKNGRENFQPRWSPDGKEVAFLENRTTLKVLNLASGQARVVMPGDMSYSYADGDQSFDWSPDGKSLLATFVDRQRWGNELGLFDAQGKAPMLNLTQSGYEDFGGQWVMGGKAMIWATERQGLRGTSGSSQQDVFAMFFTREAYERFKLDRAAFAEQKAREEDDEKQKDKDKDKPKDKATPGAKKVDKAAEEDDAPKLPEPVKIERDGLEDRIVRLTPNSGHLRAAAMSPDGETLFFILETAEHLELWSHRPREEALKKLDSFDGPSGDRGEGDAVDLQLDAKGETGFVLVGGRILHFKPPKDADGDIKPEPVKFSAEMRLDRAAERRYMFEHAWRQMREKLYVQDMGGVDWAGLRRSYERFLPHITNNHDFAEMLSELLGELNVSHTGSGYTPQRADADATASLGVFYDDAHTGAGARVAEVIEGGPLAVAGSRVKAGMVIEQIDGTAIAAGAEFDSLLNRKAGKRVLLKVLDPATGQRFDQVVKPIGLRAQRELLYRRWVNLQREAVERLSKGRLGYVHVRGMDDASYRVLVAEALGRHSAKEGLVVDTRFNGGGNLHDELITFLSGKRYLEFLPRGQSIGWEPANKWTKPSVVLMGESNYSDAHLFPWAYKHFGLGKLVGMPVPGTGTAVWWETLIDPTLYFGIPQVGFRDQRGEFMETAQVEPDIRVKQDPARIATGQDEQLEAAVKALLGP